MTEQQPTTLSSEEEQQKTVETVQGRDRYAAEHMSRAQENRGTLVGGLRADVGVRTGDAERIARAEAAVLRAAVEERKKEREILARLEQQNTSAWCRLKNVFHESAHDTEAGQELERQRDHYRNAVNLVHAIRAERIVDAPPEEQKRMQEVITRDVFLEADRLYNAKTAVKAQQLGVGKFMAPVGRFFQREDVRALCKKNAKVVVVGGVALAVATGGVMTILRQTPKLAIMMGAKGPLVMTAAKAAGMMSVAGGAVVGGAAGRFVADWYGKRRLRQDKEITQDTLVQGDVAAFRDVDVANVITEREQLRRKADRNKKIATLAGAAAGGALGYAASGHISHDTPEHAGDGTQNAQGGSGEAQKTLPPQQQMGTGEQSDHSQAAQQEEPVEKQQPLAQQAEAGEQTHQDKAEQQTSPAAEEAQPVSAAGDAAAVEAAENVAATREVIFDIKSGNTMWGRIKEHLSDTYGDDFNTLPPQQQNSVIDHFENQLQALEASGNYATLKSMGFGVLKRVGHEDVDYIRPGDRINMTEILGNDAEVRRVLAASGGDHRAAVVDVPDGSSASQAPVSASEAPVAQAPQDGVVPQPEQVSVSPADDWAHAPRSISIPEAHTMSGGISQEAFAGMLSNDAAWHIAQTERLPEKNDFDRWLLDVSRMEGMTPHQGEALEHYIARYNSLHEQHHSGAVAQAVQESSAPDATYTALAQKEFSAAQPSTSSLFTKGAPLAQAQFFGFGDDAVRFHGFLESTRVADFVAQTQHTMRAGVWTDLAIEERRGRAWVMLAQDVVSPQENETMSHYINRFLHSPDGQMFEYRRLATVAPRDVEIMTQQLNEVLFRGHMGAHESQLLAGSMFVVPQEDIAEIAQQIDIEQPGNERVDRLVQRIIGSGRGQSVVEYLSRKQ